MPQFYKVLKADALGDPWTSKHADAKPIQNYWCQVEGEELAVSIGKQVPNTVSAGEHVYGELMKATSQKGTDYWKFKSVKVPEGVQRPANEAVPQQPSGGGDSVPAWFVPFAKMIEYTFKEMKKMNGEDEPAEEPDTTEAPMDEDTKATLEELFPSEED